MDLNVTARHNTNATRGQLMICWRTADTIQFPSSMPTDRPTTLLTATH